MNDLDLKINPLSQLKIYRLARNIVLRKMDNKKITSKKAMKIINYLKKNVRKIKSARMAKIFYTQVASLFPELHDLERYFDSVQRERLDQLMSLLVEKIMKTTDLDKASKIMDKIEKAKSKSATLKVAKELEIEFPDEFGAALKSVII
jgi:hypothetical protein